MEYQLPKDLYYQIISFLFWDKRTTRFADHLRKTKKGRDKFLTMIEKSEVKYNTSNLENFSEIYFPTEYFGFFFCFCKNCGNYTYSYNMNKNCMSPKTECNCNF